MQAMKLYGGVKTYLRSLATALDVASGHIHGLTASPPGTQPR